MYMLNKAWSTASDFSRFWKSWEVIHCLSSESFCGDCIKRPPVICDLLLWSLEGSHMTVLTVLLYRKQITFDVNYTSHVYKNCNITNIVIFVKHHIINRYIITVNKRLHSILCICQILEVYYRIKYTYISGVARRRKVGGGGTNFFPKKWKAKKKKKKKKGHSGVKAQDSGGGGYCGL